MNSFPQQSFTPLFASSQFLLVVRLLLVDRFFVLSGFTSVSKFYPKDPTEKFLLVLLGFVVVDDNVVICASMELIFTVICANCVMTSELELVSTALACASPSSS